MPAGLKRYYATERLHFVTCSCYGREPLLGRSEDRDLFLTILEEVRQRYRLVVAGYVVMPDHFHLLTNEPEVGDPSVVMQVLKQRVARRLLPTRPGLEHFWYPRFYDFNVWSRAKRIEKLNYMHNNPVTRGLVTAPANGAGVVFVAMHSERKAWCRPTPGRRLSR